MLKEVAPPLHTGEHSNPSTISVFVAAFTRTKSVTEISELGCGVGFVEGFRVGPGVGLGVGFGVGF
jgi:hypothetical protein